MLAVVAAPISITALLPEIVLAATGCAVLLIGLGKTGGRNLVPWLTVGGIVAAMAAGMIFRPIGADGGSMEGNGLSYGRLAEYVRSAGLIVGVILALVLWSSTRLPERGEFFSMLLFALAGLLLVGAANNLAVLFLALELVSIPIYVMVTLSRTHPRTLEAGTKYFYLGAVSAALTAYGFSFIYGLAGSSSLESAVSAVAAALKSAGTMHFTIAAVGLTLSIGGLLFKIAAVPLHFYIADVYQGASSSIAALLGFVPKLAGFVAIFKIVALTDHWGSVSSYIFWMLWTVSLLSMTIGNALALMQTSMRRMLAYSGIAHTGYMLLGVLAGPGTGASGMIGDGTAAVLYYAVIYGLANLAAFAIIGTLRVRGELCETVQDVAGLVSRQPMMAILLAVAMFTLMGLPPLPGFWGKLNLFGSVLALASSSAAPPQYPFWLYFLVVAGVLNTAVGAAYYLRVVAAMFLYENDRPAEEAPNRDITRMGAQLAGMMILIFAFAPKTLMSSSAMATAEIREMVSAAKPGIELARANLSAASPTPQLTDAQAEIK